MTKFFRKFRPFFGHLISVLMSFFVLSSNFNTVSAYHPVDTFVKRGYVLWRQQKEGPGEGIRFLENGKFILFGWKKEKGVFLEPRKPYFLKGSWNALEEDQIQLTFDDSTSYVCKFFIYINGGGGFLKWCRPDSEKMLTWKDGASYWWAAMKIVSVLNFDTKSKKNEDINKGVNNISNYEIKVCNEGVNKIVFPPKSGDIVTKDEFFGTDGTFYGFEFFKDQVKESIKVDFNDWILE